MGNEAHLAVLKQGANIWNAFRATHPKAILNLSHANLNGTNLSNADLSGTNLSYAYLGGADLRAVNLSYAYLVGADLSGAFLRRALLRRAHLSYADLSGTILSHANLRHVDLSGATLRSAFLVDADLRRVNLSEADLSDANLGGADLSGAYLGGANLSGANLSGARLDEATLTDACLWESQRADWSIHNVICEAAYWDREQHKRTRYQPGEFERLFAEHTKIVLHFEELISPIEIATLPALIQQLSAIHAGCALRLEAIHSAVGGATVTLVMEDAAPQPDEVVALKTQLETVSQQLISHQRNLLEDRTTRASIQGELESVYDKMFPRHPGRSVMNVTTNGPVYRNQIGAANENAKVSYNDSDLASIKVIVDDMSAKRADLRLTAQQWEQLERQLNLLREHVTALTPNHSVLREALDTVRHILEAGVAHGLVAPWLHALQDLGAR